MIIKRKCLFCKKSFKRSISPDNIKRSKNRCKFCSPECGNKFKKGKNHYFWKGGKQIDKSGYIRIYNPKHPFAQSKGYVFEHRLVMEKKIGRYLKPRERVHHINGIKDDNKIINLILFSNSGKHIHFHNKILYPKSSKFGINS